MTKPMVIIIAVASFNDRPNMRVVVLPTDTLQRVESAVSRICTADRTHGSKLKETVLRIVRRFK